MANVIRQRIMLSDVKRKLLERYAYGLDSQTGEAARAVYRRPLEEPIPLSLYQEQIWRDAIEGNKVKSFYNESAAIHRRGDLDRQALERAFTEVIRRHEAWRTTFDEIDGVPVQIIHPAPATVTVPYVDLRGMPEGSRRKEALRLATEDARRPFDLKRGPLVRTLLVTVDERVHSLFVTMHQSVTDGVSVYQVLPTEITSLYSAFTEAEAPRMPDLPVQYADFAHWERQTLYEQVLTRESSYWQKQLSPDPPQLEWPSEYVASPSPDSRGAIRAFTLTEELCDEITALSRREGTTVFITLLAAFTALLSRYTGQEDITVGTVAPAGRRHIEVQKLLGYFLNPVALRVDLSGDPSVRELLRRCSEITSGALSHDVVPLEYLREQLSPTPRPARAWPFNMAITLAPSTPELTSGWSQTAMDCDSGWARWDLYLEFSIKVTGMEGRAQYRTSLFSPEIVSGVIEDLEALLKCFVLDCKQHLSALPRFCAN